ncbi:MAG: hypothetical protein ACRD18_04990 [Terriglobia bacterium]
MALSLNLRKTPFLCQPNRGKSKHRALISTLFSQFVRAFCTVHETFHRRPPREVPTPNGESLIPSRSEYPTAGKAAPAALRHGSHERPSQRRAGSTAFRASQPPLPHRSTLRLGYITNLDGSSAIPQLAYAEHRGAGGPWRKVYLQQDALGQLFQDIPFSPRAGPGS